MPNISIIVNRENLDRTGLVEGGVAGALSLPRPIPNLVLGNNVASALASAP
jgi:hypothetical protein